MSSWMDWTKAVKEKKRKKIHKVASWSKNHPYASLFLSCKRLNTMQQEGKLCVVYVPATCIMKDGCSWQALLQKKSTLTDWLKKKRSSWKPWPFSISIKQTNSSIHLFHCNVVWLELFYWLTRHPEIRLLFDFLPPVIQIVLSLILHCDRHNSQCELWNVFM